MRVRYSFLVMFYLFGAGLCACGGDERDMTGTITIKKAARGIKKGRIVEKTGVVKIPLTAAENNLKGKVHTVRIREYKLAEDKGRTLTDSSYNVYDTAGHLIEQNGWDAKGKRRWRCTYTYNKGKLAEWDLDLNGGREKNTTVFFYNAAGNKVKSVTHSSDILETGRKEYRYDNMGNETEMKEYSASGRLRKHIRSQYDGAGNQVLQADLFPDGTLYKATKAEYDAYGSLTALVQYEGDKITGSTKMRNDAYGKHVAVAMLRADSTVEARAEYAYDTAGNMVEHIKYLMPDENTPVNHLTFKYEYDNAGNMTRQTTVVIQQGKREAVKVVEYQYTYYP